MSDLYLFALANFVLCSLIGFIAVCRLNSMDGGVLRRVRSEYAGYFTAATISGFQPWFGEWPGWACLGMSVAVLLGLLSSAHAWPHDHPPAIASGLSDFDDSPHHHDERQAP